MPRCAGGERGEVERVGDYARRETFLIGPDGKVIKRYRNVDPEKNVKQVLADLADKKGKV